MTISKIIDEELEGVTAWWDRQLALSSTGTDRTVTRLDSQGAINITFD